MDDGIKNIGNEHYKTLIFDVEKYQALLDSDDIPEDKKVELLETLWAIMVQFVDMGFGIHPLQNAEDRTDKKLHPEVVKMIADVANTNTSKNLKEAWPEERTDV